MGDSVDNIPGLPRCGPKKVWTLLHDLATEDELWEAAKDAYTDVYGDTWEAELMEQAQLVWMCQEMNEDGSPVMWRMPDDGARI